LFAISKIGNTNVNLLIDTGSPASLLSVEIFEMLGFDKSILQIENPLLTGANGGEIEVYGKAKIKFDLNSTPLEHEFVIAKLDMQGILGMEFLEENDAHIFISTSKLKIKQNSIPLLRNLTKVCAFVKTASCTDTSKF